MKKLLKSLLMLAIVLMGVCFVNVKGNTVLAAESEKTYKSEQVTLSSLDDSKIPVCSDDTQEWLFAGWYKDAACEMAYHSFPTDTTTAYAKFVPEKVLSVKLQLTEGTEGNSSKTNMRLVSSVDSLNYQKVGFKVYFKGAEESINIETTKVYERIVASAESGVDYNYSPKVVNVESEYFVTATLINITQANFKESFFIRPYWVSLDGTTVYGENRYVTVEDGYDINVINMPIKMSSNPGNSLTVSGITEATASLANYDGIYAHVRIRIPETTNRTELASTTKVNVSGGSITGNDVYRNLLTTHESGDATTPNADTSWYDVYKDDSSVNHYVIATSADLYGLAKIVNDVSGEYADEVFAGKTVTLCSNVLMNQGVAASTGWTPTDGALQYAWEPIGGNAVVFEGIFDGDDNTVEGLVVKDTDAVGYAGLFGQASGTIKNFSITNSYLESNGGKVGSVVGHLAGNLVSVYSTAYVNNSATQNTSGEFETGGLVGRYAADGEKKISDCWFEGAVTSTNRACGGLVGRVVSGNVTIENCLNTGSVHNAINAGAWTGGLVGGVVSSDSVAVSITIDNVLNTGNVSLDNKVYTTGSFIGYVASGNTITIADSYATNECFTDSDEGKATIGYYTGATVNGNVELCVEEDITGYTSYNTISALDYSTYSNPDGFWVVREDGVPGLKSFVDNWIDVEWFYDAGEEGYVIRTAEELYGFSAIGQDTTFEGRTVKLGADIELNKGVAEKWGTVAPSRAWKKVGNASTANFYGTFDGQGHTISGMYLKENTGEQGMFGRTNATSVIKNFRLENSYFEVTDGATIVGSIVGYSRGEVSGVYSDAYVVGTDAIVQAGGIVGCAYGYMTDYVPTSTVTVDDCWFDGHVVLKGTAREGGGIIGRVAQGAINISNCLFTGTVSSERTATERDVRVGGIMAIQNSYSVIEITNCLSDGTLVVNDFQNVGSVVGRLRDTYNETTGVPRSSYTMLGVYATEECSMDSAGTAQAAYNCSTADVPNGGVEVCARADIQGEKGFTLTGLDFTDYWIAKEESTPELKTFSTDGIKVPSMQPYIGWYNPSATEHVIKRVNELYGFANLAVTNSFEGQTVKLGANIVVNETDRTLWEETPPENVWTPIGYSADTKGTFKGIFDGQGHTISGLYMDGDISTGLFWSLENATVQNMRLENNDMASSAQFSGGLAMNIKNSTLDSIYCDTYVRTVTSASEAYSGGFVGNVLGGTNKFTNCWFAGNVYSNKAYFSGMIGGAVNALNTKITVENCLVTGTLSSSVSGNSNVGGFCGRMRYTGTNMTVKNSLFAGKIEYTGTGSLKNAAYFVGLMGRTGEESTLTISNSYCINDTLNDVTYTNANTNENSKIVAWNQTASTAGTYNDGVIGEPTFIDKADITGENGLTLTGLDFTNYWAAKTDTTKTPELLSFTDDSNHTPSKTQAYTGWYEPNNTDKTEYVLTTVNELYGLSVLSADGYDFAGQKITLGADIVINDKTTYGDALNWGTTAPDYQWTPIRGFAGEFDGSDYSISGIYVYNTTTATSQGVGLFGETTSTSSVHNLRLENSYIFSSKRNVGGIAGIGAGTFDTIYSEGIIDSKNYYVGGIVGHVIEGTQNKISNCWYNGQITLTTNSGWEAGGIVGYVENDGNTMTIENCLNSADISCAKSDTTKSVIGGICGGIYQGNVDVKTCLNVGTFTVVGTDWVGSIIGSVRKDKAATASISYTYGVALEESIPQSCPGVGFVSSTYEGDVTGEATLLENKENFYGEDAKTNAPNLFDETITTAWTTVDGAVPVLKSFEDYTVPGAKIVSNGVVKKTIVYTNDEYESIATTLKAKLKELTGFDFEIQNDISAGIVTDSIVIGKIYTEECISLYDKISGEDFALAAVGSNIYLCGTNTTTLQSAYDSLVGGIKVQTIDEKTYATVPSDLFTLENDTTASGYQLLGTSLAKYSIVIDDEASELSQLMAEYFKEQVFTKTNIYLEIVTDATASCGYDIVFGSTDRTVSSSVYTDGAYNNTEYGYTIVSVDNSIAVGYTDSTARISACEKLMELFTTDTSEGINLTGTDENVSKVVKSDDAHIRVMSSNIYTQNGTDFNESLGDKMPSWEVRAEIMAEVYRTYKPDFFGLQEASFAQQDEILKYIDDLYAKVEFTGTSKNQTPIFYRKDLYQVEEQKYYDFGSGRHYEWALYSTIGNADEKFIHMNLHYNPVQSLQAGDAQIVNNEIKRLMEVYPSVPIAVTGDYNNNATSDTYATMVNGINMASGAALVANTDSTYYTWHSLGNTEISTEYKDGTTGPIDIVSITTDLLEAKDYKVVYNPIVCWGSDHYPVFLDVARK